MIGNRCFAGCSLAFNSFTGSFSSLMGMLSSPFSFELLAIRAMMIRTEWTLFGNG